jgi:hypothetical protein
LGAMNPRVIAIDWSGAATGAESRIWLAEARDGEIIRLECGRSRDSVAEHIIAESKRTPELVVGLDFAFGLPKWFLTERGLADGPALWELVSREGEQWLASCEPPFWGRPGRGRPQLSDDLRRTDREAPAIGGIRPKSVFQIGGAGAVGTGSLRGMPVLKRLRDAGFAVWPFDPPRWPLVIEIYPRVLTGAVNKGNAEARSEYLRRVYPSLDRDIAARAASSEDAFDAAVSALVMAGHLTGLDSLAEIDDEQLRSEGMIWAPRQEAGVPDATAREGVRPKAHVHVIKARRQFDSSVTRVAPVFCALANPGQPGWVGELLDLVSEGSGSRPWADLDLRPLEGRWGQEEAALLPPVSLLSWLVRHMHRLPIVIPDGDDETTKKRRALMEGDPATIQRALASLRSSSVDRAWWVLEGPTCPDAYIVTPDALIVIEGKRTEAGPTTHTTRMPNRHQMLRHIDAAWEIRGNRSVFGFFVVEADVGEHPTAVPTNWREAARATTGRETIDESLPHRGPDDREGITRAFLGVTTWQAIVARFGLNPDQVLPRTAPVT